MKNIIICLLIFLFCLSSVSAYDFVLGYGMYGMNHSKVDKIIGLIPEELFLGLDKIVFSNSKCVDTKITFYNNSYGVSCASAYFDFWTNGANKISIGDFDERDEEEILEDLLHELGHLDDWRELGWDYYYMEEVDKELYAEIFCNTWLKELGYGLNVTYYFNVSNIKKVEEVKGL